MRISFSRVSFALVLCFVQIPGARLNELDEGTTNLQVLDEMRNNADSLRAAWVEQYFSDASTSYATRLAVDRSGNVYVTGKSTNFNGSSDFLTIKYNRRGAVQWMARYSGASNFVDALMFIAIDHAGNVYVAGSNSGPRLNSDYLTIKYNPQGQQQWVARYNSLFNNDDFAFALAVDRQCNIYVTGKSYSGTSWDCATIKYDALGVERWVARYDGANNSWDEATALAVDDGGNIYVTGWSEVGNKPSDYVTIKYSPQGTVEWVAQYNNTRHSWSSDRATALGLDGAGNVYVTGKSLLGDASQYYVTIKYDKSGRQEWIADYDKAVLDVPGFSPRLAVDATGNVYVAGAGGCNSPYTDLALIKYSKDGVQKWLACYNGPANNLDYAAAFAVDYAKNVYVAGTSYNDASSEFITLKYDKDGVLKWLARFDDPSSTFDESNDLAIDGLDNVYVTGFSASDLGSKYTSIKYAQKLPPNRYYLAQNYPNPFNVYTIIRFEIPKASQVTIKIYDLMGREVFRLIDENLEAGEYERIWSGEICAPFTEASGVYFMRMQTAEFTIVKKLVLLK